MILVRRARPDDAPGIARVHVAAWRDTYAGLLPEDYLARLSVTRQAMAYDRMIRARQGVLVAGEGADVVGFASVGPARPGGLGDGEVHTLYVLNDFREQGLGRRLLRAGALHMAQAGCRSVFLWVLRDNPSRWFYQRLGGRAAMESETCVAGWTVPQTAYVWDPIDLLLAAPARS